MTRSMLDVAIIDGTIVSTEGTCVGSIGISDGKIVAITADGSELPAAVRQVSAKGCYVLPGVIDTHVHFRDPGLTDREDFVSGSAAAVSGGVTTVFDMPNTIPVVATREALDAKKALIRGRSRVDFGLLGAVGRTNVSEISGMYANGVVGFKFFLNHTVGGLEPCDDESLLAAFDLISKLGGVACLHAEDPHVIHHLTTQLRAEFPDDATAVAKARPAVAETEMVERCLHYASLFRTRLHVCHVSAGSTVAAVRKAKRRGLPVTAETGPQWLMFSEEDMAALQQRLIFTPPFRSPQDRDELWRGLLDGTIDTIGTDHAPRFLQEKNTASPWEAMSGFIGVETSLPLLWRWVAEGRLTPQQVAKISSGNAARIFGLAAKKGRIAIGMDADVTVIEQVDWVIDQDQLKSKAKFSPFDGMHAGGRVRHTLVGGVVHVLEGQLQSADAAGVHLFDRHSQQT